METLITLLLTAITGRSKASYVRKTQQIQAVQETFLKTLLRLHENTAFGNDYKLAEISTIEQFRDRIPVTPYSVYEPYVERIAQGEPNVLTVDPVIYLNLTSGSTGKQKLIPVTRRSRRILQGVNSASIGFVVAAAHRHHLPVGKMLLTSSVQLFGHTSAGIPYGPVSVGDIRMSRSSYRQLLAYPFEVLQISDSLARHYVCLLFALRNRNTGVIGANFPILALRLCDYLECYAEDLIHDLETGAIADWLDIHPNLRAHLQKLFSADPRRATELRQILKTEGRLTPKLAWSNLSLIITARGGTSNFYFERFPTYFGDTPVFGGIYASSEATFGTYHDINDDGVILGIDAGFFEFIPEDQWEVEHPKTLLPWEVTVGNYYRIVVTNYSGLYRYDIGDVVEVLGFYNQTPLIAFRYRLGGLLSSTSEKTTEFHAAQVMNILQQKFKVSLESFCITLSENDYPAHYLVNIELAANQSLDDPHKFLQQFDDTLKEIHVSYAKKRMDQVPVPRLRILAPGSFAQLRQSLLQGGVPESQLKFPHITENRQWLAGLTVQQEVRFPEDN